MNAEENAVLHNQRVVRLYPARVREHGGALPGAGDDGTEDPRARADESSPGLAHRGQHLDDVAARLDHRVESKLREPLSQIATIASVLKDELNDIQREQVEAVLDAAGRAEGMLSSVLDFVRTGVGGMPIARRRVDLKVLCERVVDAIHANHPDRPMLFACDSRLEGEFDPDAIAALLSKLVVNAIDHGAARPAIRVELRALENDIVLDVWNAGPALDTDLQGKVFEPFVCGRSVRPGRIGLGLGLYLAREIVRAHGGWIDVQSGDREGTTFRVTLPRR
jgi:signal transduction histidine kinase